ncbi:hypothetical protein F4808DRAFT_423584 [Astrocystis sublimbata]|nr:hypothetical protein F4808DRAFT_423584 [Astrocystis sublimbata]
MSISQEEVEMAESPIIPPTLIQSYSHTQPHQRSHSAAGSQGPDLGRWKSRVPKTGTSPLVPQPLFTSEKCILEEEPATNTGGTPVLMPTLRTAIVASTPTSSYAPTTATSTPISPTPSLFPVPPSNVGITASPVSMVSPLSLHPSSSVVSRSSVYSQSTIRRTLAAERPRPVSSVYSQNTVTTVTVTAPPSPRSPTLTNWSSTLPGLQNSGTTPTNVHPRTRGPVYTEEVPEVPPVPQHMQMQVPQIRSPGLPQDRIHRKRAVSDAGGLDAYSAVEDANSSNKLLAHGGPRSVSHPPMKSAAPTDYEGAEWPLQKPSVVHDIPRQNYVSRPQASDNNNISKSAPRSYHIANKESTSSSTSQMGPYNKPDTTSSPRTSMAESHTPIFGPGEQRSEWWDDEDDAAANRGISSRISGRISKYAAIGMGMKEKRRPVTDAKRRRARNIKIIVGGTVLVIVIVVAVAVAVTLSKRGSS